MPHLDGQYDLDIWPSEFHQYALNHRYRSPNTDPEHVSFWPTTPEDVAGRGNSILSGEFIYQWAKGAFERSEKAGNPFQNRVAVSSFWSTFNARPVYFLKDIAPTPLLWIATDEDVVSGPLEKDRQAFDELQGDKTMVILHGGHLENYFRGELLKGVKAMVDFIIHHA